MCGVRNFLPASRHPANGASRIWCWISHKHLIIESCFQHNHHQKTSLVRSLLLLKEKWFRMDRREEAVVRPEKELIWFQNIQTSFYKRTEKDEEQRSLFLKQTRATCWCTNAVTHVMKNIDDAETKKTLRGQASSQSEGFFLIFI